MTYASTVESALTANLRAISLTFDKPRTLSTRSTYRHSVTGLEELRFRNGVVYFCLKDVVEAFFANLLASLGPFEYRTRRLT